MMPSSIHRRPAARAIALAVTLLGASTAAPAQSSRPTGAPVSTRIAGTFDVTLTPQPADAYADGAMLGRMTIDKRFHGALDAASKGQMLSAMTGTKGSAGYVAIERVDGTLDGRRGSFVLQHLGTMERGAQRLVVAVVPDSGTGELTGLAGTMTIDTSGGGHRYEFTYTLPAPE